MSSYFGKKLSLSSKVSIRTPTGSIDMPVFGFGTYKIEPAKVEDAVTWALLAGYRMVDTAQAYNNEAGIGKAFKSSGVKREDVFVVSKVDIENHGKVRTTKAVKDSLKNLQTDFIDLHLIHHPGGGNVIDTYRALLDLKEDGKIRAVGVSHFGVQHLEGLREAGLPTPSVNQIELHPYNRNDEIVDYCRQKGIAVMGFSPNVRGMKMDDPVLRMIASAHKMTVTQVLIRWSLQRGFITIPKSVHEGRIVENSQVFDFALNDSEMTTLNSQQQDPRTRGMFPEKYPWQEVA